MLRYFYILICILQSFCNGYIHGNQGENAKRSRNHGSSENVRDHGSNKVVLDVASFIQNSLTEKIQDYGPYSYKNTKQNDALTQSEDYYESQMNENVKEREGSDYLNTDDLVDSDSKYSISYSGGIDAIQTDSKDNSGENEGSILNRDDKIKRNYVNELLIDNPEKKCAFKNMKVPFFSRKKSSKEKKHKKLFCFNCANTYSETEASGELKKLNGKIKRAYGDLCPKCIKALLTINPKEKPVKDKKKKEKTGQSGKDMKTTTLSGKKLIDSEADANFENLYIYDYVRAKRYNDEDRERRLKELAEVEKKVDHVKITSPQFTRMPIQ